MVSALKETSKWDGHLARFVSGFYLLMVKENSGKGVGRTDT